MDDSMRAVFARQGYIVVPDVLNQQQLDELNQVYDQHVLEREETLSAAGTDKQNRFYIGGRDKNVTTDRHGNTYMGRRFWSKAYMDLIDNETMLMKSFGDDIAEKTFQEFMADRGLARMMSLHGGMDSASWRRGDP